MTNTPDDADELIRYAIDRQRQCGFRQDAEGDFVFWDQHIAEVSRLKKQVDTLYKHVQDARNVYENYRQHTERPNLSVARVIARGVTGSKNVDFVLQILSVERMPDNLGFQVNVSWPYGDAPKASAAEIRKSDAQAAKEMSDFRSGIRSGKSSDV